MDNRAFSVAAPQAWNWLPLELKLVKDTLSFMKQLKFFYFLLHSPRDRFYIRNFTVISASPCTALLVYL